MAKQAALVEGTPEVDLDKLQDGVAISVSQAGPVQGEYKLVSTDTPFAKEYPWEVFNVDGSVRAVISVKQR